MNQTEIKTSKLKRNLIEWGVIGGVIAILYFTGLHTHVLGTMQRAMLLTGFFDAKPDVTHSDGPMLSNQDYRFRMVTSKGEEFTLGDFEGSVTFVNVWASWCPPCIAEMPTIETLHRELNDRENIRFILLSLDEDRERAVNFMEGRNFSLPYHFPESPVPAALRSGVLPTTYVISKKGQIVYKKQGIADYSSPVFRDWLIELSEEDPR